jgi:serine/threonine protein kinase/sugar lactone lactonase YvrE
MSEPENPSAFAPPVSAFTGPVAELIAQRMLTPPPRPGLLAVLDHFEILRILGGGGMGIVLLARDTRTGRDMAVKLVKSELVTNQEVVHRFLKEAGHLKKLRHTNIVPVDEISDKPEAPYFVMPYFEKGSLANRIKPGEPLGTPVILDMAAQVAEGLSFAHRSGIIHRDLKPANILVASDRVCLGDFGLARTVFNDSIVDVERQQLEGTAPYMSPAVAAGDAEDTRCDIYSFGALLYEMLTGRPPYQGRSTKEILNKIIAGPPPPITSLNPNADRGLVAVAEKAMARELRDRYADMRDILKDLQRIREGKQPDGAGKNGQPVMNYLMVIAVPIALIIVALLLWVLSKNNNKSAATVQQPTTTQSPVTAQSPVPSPPAPLPTVVKSPPVTNQVPIAVTTPTPIAVTPVAVPGFITFAGQPAVKGYTDGPVAQAEFRLPNNVAVDGSGNVYVADTANDVIRKITPDGMVSTLAGAAHSHGSADGQGSQARFWAPFGIAVDASGIIYVADTANNTIRKITPGGIVSTFAGLAGHPGTNDGANFSARFRNPWSVAVDSSNNVFVADMSNDTIRKITPEGMVHTFAGRAGMIGNTDGFGNDARFDNPFAVAVDSAGDVYVSDSANNAIRKITAHRVVTTLAGLPGYAGNADGSSTDARFWNPQGLAVDSAGNIYVADTGNNLIRKVTPMGVVSTLLESGQGDEIVSQSVHLKSPGGVAVDSAGNVYVADTDNHCIRKIAATK